MALIILDVCDKVCPVPLVETRKAIRKSAPGDVIKVTGTHPQSRDEIPMAAEALGLRFRLSNEDISPWTITIFR